MPKATKIVIEFDDGTVYDIDPSNAGSIFTSEASAKKCKHDPPYDKPPKPPKKKDADTGGGTASLMSTADTTNAAGAAEGGGCYIVNGVIVCP